MRAGDQNPVQLEARSAPVTWSSLGPAMVAVASVHTDGTVLRG